MNGTRVDRACEFWRNITVWDAPMSAVCANFFDQ